MYVKKTELSPEAPRSFVPQAKEGVVWRRVMKTDQTEPRSCFRHKAQIAVSGGAFDLRICRAAEHLERNGSKIFINQAVLQELRVNGGAAFAQQSSNAVFAAKDLHSQRQVSDSAISGSDDFHRARWTIRAHL